MSDFIANLIPVLETVAPTLAAALGGPFAGGIVCMLEKEFGLSGDDLIATIAAPESKDKLQKLESENVLLAEIKAQEANIENARSAAVNVRSRISGMLLCLLIMSVACVLIGFGLLLYSFITPSTIDDPIAETFARILIGGPVGFWFGYAAYKFNKK